MVRSGQVESGPVRLGCRVVGSGHWVWLGPVRLGHWVGSLDCAGLAVHQRRKKRRMSDHYESDEKESGLDIDADNDLSIAFAQV